MKQTPYRQLPIHPLSCIPFRRAGLTVNIGLEKFTMQPLLDVIVRAGSRHRRMLLQRLPSLVPETNTAVSPMHYVVPVDKTRVRAARPVHVPRGSSPWRRSYRFRI